MRFGQICHLALIWIGSDERIARDPTTKCSEYIVNTHCKQHISYALALLQHGALHTVHNSLLLLLLL